MTEESHQHKHEWLVVCRTCDAKPDVSSHYVNFTDDSWSVEHSLQCRMDGEMQRGCAYERAVRLVSDDWMQPPPEQLGRWRITEIDSDGLPALERAFINA